MQVGGSQGSQSIREARRLLSFLPQRRIKALRLLALLSLVPGFLDFASIAVVGRLTGSLVGGNLSNFLPGIRVFGGSKLEQSLWLIGFFVGLIWLQSLMRIVLRLAQERTASQIWLDLSERIFCGIIYQPYEYHLSSSLANLSSDLLGSLDCLLKEIVTPALRALSSLVSILIITVGIIYIGRESAALLLLVMISGYIITTGLMTPRLRFSSQQKLRTRDRFVQVFFESFRSIRDVKLIKAEDFFTRSFRESTLEYKIADTQLQVLPEVPRMLIEALGITAIFILGVLPKLLSGDQQQVFAILPFLAVLSIGALRLTKPLQDLFTAIARLRGGLPELNAINKLLSLQDRTLRIGLLGQSSNSLFPQRTISLKDASYSYPESDCCVLKDISLSIPVGSRVAFVGPTGSGKSTAAHLLLGLLSPQKGCLSIDGVPVDQAEIHSWYSCCSQVPQNIQLYNGSVCANIAFGEEEKNINYHRVWDALEAAQINEFIADLPYGLHTQIGENGINLSGGQRQRIALARAFYRQSTFLVLDEATSALDNQTESDVIQSLEIVGRRCTTLVIAHRLTTIQRCDRIYEFSDGRIVHSGDYTSLQKSSESFRRLVQLQQLDGDY